MDVWSYLVGKAKGGGGPSPSGTIEITENGTYDVTSKATANVNVSGGGGDLTEYFDVVIDHDISGDTGVNYKYPLKKMPSYTITSNVTNLRSCFDHYIETIINLSELDTSNVTNMREMFYYCGYVKEIDCSNFDTSKVTTMQNMFNSCSNVRKINLSNATIKDDVVSMSGMFQYCNYLAVIDVSNMEFSKLQEGFYDRMFTSCGGSCSIDDGAYANGISYVYVKNATEQNWILTANNGHPSSWTTANVVIKS